MAELLDVTRSPDETRARWLVHAAADGLVTLSLPTSFARPGQHPLGEPSLCPWVVAHFTREEATELLTTLAAGVRQVGGDPRDALLDASL